jgi:hypothetical protein
MTVETDISVEYLKSLHFCLLNHFINISSIKNGLRDKKRSKGKECNKKDISKTYNEYKEFEVKQYSGMKVGRRRSIR